MYSTKAGTIGGTLLVVLLQIKSSELVKTALLAAIGAAVSFGVSLFMRWTVKRMKKKMK